MNDVPLVSYVKVTIFLNYLVVFQFTFNFLIYYQRYALLSKSIMVFFSKFRCVSLLSFLISYVKKKLFLRKIALCLCPCYVIWSWASINENINSHERYSNKGLITMIGRIYKWRYIQRFDNSILLVSNSLIKLHSVRKKTLFHVIGPMNMKRKHKKEYHK